MAVPFAALLSWMDGTVAFDEGKGCGSAPAESGQLNLKTLSAISKFAEACLGIEVTVSTDCSHLALAEELGKTLQAITHMAQRLQKATSARVTIAVAQKELDMTDENMKLLPKSLQMVAHAMRISWDKELEAVTAMDMNHMSAFTMKIPIAEAAYVITNSNSLQDEVFADVRTKAEQFGLTFSKRFGSAIDVGADVYMSPLKIFVDKYGELLPAVETWTLKDVEWIFLKEKEDEVKGDIANLREGAKQGRNFMNSLDSLAKHSSSAAMLQVLQKLAVATQQKMKEKIEETGKLAHAMIFAHLYLCGNGSDVETSKVDVISTEKHTQKYFGLSASNLPQALQEKINEISKRQVPGGTSAEKGKDSKEKTQNQKKEKEKDNKDKDKKRRDSDASTKPKDKKSKK